MQLPNWMPFQGKKQEGEPKPSSPPKGEVSFRDPLLYPQGTMWSAYNPDIFVMRKGGLYVYDKMRRDEQIKACQWIKRLAVLCSGWKVEPVSEESIDVEVAEFCEDTLKRLRGTLEEKIKNILSGMDYGFSISEKVWGIVEEGDFKGKIGLRALKVRKPHSWDFDTDEYGNLRPNGLWQLNGQHKYDPKKFVVYSHNREFDNWYGTSDLQSVYRSWWSKDVIIKFWNIFLEKFGMGIPMLKPKEGGRIDDPMYTTLKNALANLQNTSAIAWNVDGPEVELLEAKRRGAGEHDKAIQYYDRAIARGLLMPTGLGFSEDDKGGSHARSRTHFDLWLWIMEDLRKTVEETIMAEQVIPELVNYNYTVKAYPRFKFNDLEDPEVLELGKLWLEALNGKAVHPNAEDEIHLRRLIKFPERDRDELEEEIEAGKVPPIPDITDNDADEGDVHIDQPLKVVQHQKWHRELTQYEKRVDFRKVEKALDGLEGETRKRLTGILEKQRDKLLNSVEKSFDKINHQWINTFNLQYGVEFQGVLKEFMRTGFEMGRGDASNEISRARKKRKNYVIKIPPKQAINMLEKSAFWIRNVTFDGITKQVQGTLLNMLETGETPGETLMKIRNLYDPYVGDEMRVIDQRQIEPYRIETVIRTNATKAYNRGKVVEFADPDLDGFVRAVQISAILDSRTTDICRNADGKIILLHDDQNIAKLTPPLHHQCRSVLVPVTEVDGVFEASKQLELDVLKQQMPPDFGGNFDKGGGWASEDILKELPAGTVKIGAGGRILNVWSGEGYQVNQLSKARYEIEFEEVLREDYQNALRGLADDVSMGEKGGRIQITDAGPGDEWTGFSSTYPEFMVNKGKHWEASRITPALKKASEGKSLGQLELNFVEDAVDSINYEKARMGWLDEIDTKRAGLIDEAENEVRRLTKEALAETTTSKETLRELEDFFDNVGMARN